MKKYFGSIAFLFCMSSAQTQDTAVLVDNQAFTLSEVVVRNNFDYRRLLTQIKEDTTFYKAFRNLRILGFTSYNDIKMLNRKGIVEASLYSKTRQNRINGCRTMDILEEKITGDFYEIKEIGIDYSLYIVVYFKNIATITSTPKITLAIPLAVMKAILTRLRSLGFTIACWYISIPQNTAVPIQ